MFGISEGPSGHEKQQTNLLDAASGFATGMGEGNLTLSSDFFRNLLQDPYKALAPQIKAQQDQISQQAKTNAEMGNRSGGTNASTQAANAQGRANLISAATGAQTGAASELASTGANLLGQGISGTEASFEENKIMHDQSAEQINSLIKDIMSTVGGGVAGFPGNPGGAQDIFSNLFSGGA